VSIWFEQPDIAALNRLHEATAVAALGIRITAAGEDSLSGTMPVDQRTRQPLGLLHGGASVALAETLGSAAAMCCVDQKAFYCVGLEINANHVRGVRDGIVTGVARPIHLGRTSQVWGIEIRGEDGRLACIARLTAAVVAIVAK
jgi:1,4-dihydroxy-2-naphthoyl-CoA hydrolase